MLDTLGVWVAAIGTISLMSFAWRENRVYRLFEHIYIGIGAGHAVAMGWQTLKSSVFTPVQEQGNYVVLIPLVLGLLLYARFFKGQAYLSRIPMAILVGLGVGLSVRGTIVSQLLKQLKASMLPLNSINNIILVIGMATVVLFFYFTGKKGGAAQKSGYIGRYVMMIAFGATFGNTVMGRMSMMIGRVQFLLGEWLHLL